MKKWRLVAILVLVALISTTAALLIWRPWSRPSVPVGALRLEGDLGAMFDPARQVNIVLINRTGRPCKATIEGGSAGINGKWTLARGEGEAGGRFSTAAPFTIKSVTIERGEEKVLREFGRTLPAGTTQEVRIGQGDTVEVVQAGK